MVVYFSLSGAALHHAHGLRPRLRALLRDDEMGRARGLRSAWALEIA